LTEKYLQRKSRPGEAAFAVRTRFWNRGAPCDRAAVRTRRRAPPGCASSGMTGCANRRHREVGLKRKRAANLGGPIETSRRTRQRKGQVTGLRSTAMTTIHRSLFFAFDPLRARHTFGSQFAQLDLRFYNRNANCGLTPALPRESLGLKTGLPVSSMTSICMQDAF
jgi:hypothetical protein